MTDCARGCVYPDQHHSECDQQHDCIGCLPVPGHPHWCYNCRDRIRDELAALPGLAHDIAARHDGRTAPTGKAERSGVNADPASPSPAFDAFDEITQWVCAWEEIFRRILGHRTPQEPSWGARRGQALSGACRWLHANVCHVLACDDVASVDFGEELHDLTRRMTRGAGIDRLVHHLPLPCLRCDRVALVRHDGSETVECRACGRRWTWDDYGRLSTAYAHVVEQETP